MPPESLAAVDKVNEHFLEEDAPTPGPPGGSRSTQFRKRDSARKQTTLFFEETMYNNFCRNYADFKTIIGASAGKRETVIESFFSDTFDRPTSGTTWFLRALLLITRNFGRSSYPGDAMFNMFFSHKLQPTSFRCGPPVGEV